MAWHQWTDSTNKKGTKPIKKRDDFDQQLGFHDTGTRQKKQSNMNQTWGCNEQMKKKRKKTLIKVALRQSLGCRTQCRVHTGNNLTWSSCSCLFHAESIRFGQMANVMYILITSRTSPTHVHGGSYFEVGKIFRKAQPAVDFTKKPWCVWK